MQITYWKNSSPLSRFYFLKKPILSVFVHQASKGNEFICFCPKRENDNYLS